MKSILCLVLVLVLITPATAWCTRGKKRNSLGMPTSSSSSNSSAASQGVPGLSNDDSGSSDDSDDSPGESSDSNEGMDLSQISVSASATRSPDYTTESDSPSSLPLPPPPSPSSNLSSPSSLSQESRSKALSESLLQQLGLQEQGADASGSNAAAEHEGSAFKKSRFEEKKTTEEYTDNHGGSASSGSSEGSSIFSQVAQKKDPYFTGPRTPQRAKSGSLEVHDSPVTLKTQSGFANLFVPQVNIPFQCSPLKGIALSLPLSPTHIYNLAFFTSWLADELDLTSAEIATQTRRIGHGAGSEVFLVHEKIPQGQDLEDQITQLAGKKMTRRDYFRLFPQLKVDEAKVEFWIWYHPNSKIVKLRKPDAQTPSDLLRRDLVLIRLFSEVVGQFEATLPDGTKKNIIQVSEYLQSKAEESRGLLKQRPIYGPTAYEIGKHIKDIDKDPSHLQALLSYGFSSVDEARFYVTHLQNFYIAIHDLVVQISDEHGLPKTENETRDGQFVTAGGDYGNGFNQKLELRTKTWVIYDP